MSGLQLVLFTVLVHVVCGAVADVLARRRRLHNRVLLVALVLAFGLIPLIVMAGLTRRDPPDGRPGDDASGGDWPGEDGRPA